VQSALLSLLFPLSWQGAFIPVLPSSMLDLLDAPVPFCVGVVRSSLPPPGVGARPAGVVFVDLDADTVLIGDSALEVGRLVNCLGGEETGGRWRGQVRGGGCGRPWAQSKGGRRARRGRARGAARRAGGGAEARHSRQP
jgi:hypothetical protein